MKTTYSAIILGTAMTLATSFAFAVDPPAKPKAGGSGTITFTGSIIDSPCTLTADTQNQTIELGQVSNKALLNQGRSVPKAFKLELQQCDISTLKTVQVTFAGDQDSVDPTLLGMTGSARGAGIALTNGSGTLVKLGEATPSHALLEGNNTLSFSAYLQGTAAKDIAITPGVYSAVTNFLLTYQ